LAKGAKEFHSYRISIELNHVNCVVAYEDEENNLIFCTNQEKPLSRSSGGLGGQNVLPKSCLPDVKLRFVSQPNDKRDVGFKPSGHHPH
jgi:hypothetical protein